MRDSIDHPIVAGAIEADASPPHAAVDAGVLDGRAALAVRPLRA